MGQATRVWHLRRFPRQPTRCSMSQPNDSKKSATPLDQDNTMIAVIEMGQASWFVAGIVPGLEGQPLKELGSDERALIRLLQRWRNEAVQAGRTIKRFKIRDEGLVKNKAVYVALALNPDGEMVDTPWAEDAIPKDGISLTDAYASVADFLFDHHELRPQFNEEWSEALLKSRELERKCADKDVFDKKLEEETQLGREANLFLRLQIEEKRLIACTRDPETGDILQLNSNGWTASSWDEYIPYNIWIDHVMPDDHDAPGPSGTMICGALRPVFFLRGEFDVWFKTTFREAVSVVARSEAGKVQFGKSPRKYPPRDAVKEAIVDLWDGVRPPPGVSEVARLDAINRWLKSHGRTQVGQATVRRALSDLSADDRA